MSRGHCVGCGVEGRGDRDFLCEDCVNPDGGMLVCRKCGRREMLTLDQLRHFAEVGMPVPLRTGVVIVLSECVDCSTDPKGDAKVYTLREVV